MYRLTGSVGEGGRNVHDDVLTVQKLLNKNAHLVAAIGVVPEDGNLDARTQAAIVAFQRTIVHLSAPDGRIDPRGRTFRILEGEQPHAATVILTQLTVTENAGGFYLYENPDRQYGTPRALESIRNIAGALKTAGITIGVGDISFVHGGHMAPHESHRRGVDVDIRPQRDDQAHAPVTINDPHYSRDRTKQVVEAIRADPNFELVLFNDKQIHGVRSWAGHDNHLHVRFKE